MRDEASEDEEPSFMTRRLAFRPPQKGDAAALSAAIDNPRVAMGLFGVPYPYRRQDAEAWIERGRAVPDRPGTMRVALCRRRGELVGAGFHQPSDSWPDGFEIGFFVAEPHWGRGYGTEIAHALVDHAFEQGGAARLWCAIRVASGPARRVAEKCGFQFRDSGMVRSIATRGMVAVERFVLERRVWSSLKAWGAERWTDEGAGELAEDDDDASDAA